MWVVSVFGEVQLENLVRTVLPPNAYDFQVQLSNGKRADCVLKLPNPPGDIVIDSKFPLETWHHLQQADDEAAPRGWVPPELPAGASEEQVAEKIEEWRTHLA